MTRTKGHDVFLLVHLAASFLPRLGLLAVFILCAIEKAGATAISDVNEIDGYVQVFQLDISKRSTFNTNAVPYNVDASQTLSLTDGANRYGYYLELQTATGPRQWVWVSMDAFTQDLTTIGVPSGGEGVVFQRVVNNLLIESNSGNITTGSKATGNLEFWTNNYSRHQSIGTLGASDTSYDWDDQPTGLISGYGSMQIHNHLDGEVIFAFNRWGYSGGNNDLGIGNRAGTDLDWTFAQNAGTFSLKSLEIWALPYEVGPNPCGLGGDETCNTADLDALYAVFNSIVPPTDALFDLNSDNLVDAADLNEWLSLAATENGHSSAYLRGDTDLDRNVDLADYSALASNFDPTGSLGLHGWDHGNSDGDNDVDLADYNVLASNFSPAGYGDAAVPEPTSLCLLLTAMLLLARIRF